jgi:hypothetical protein
MLSEWQQFRLVAEMCAGTGLANHVARLNAERGWAAFCTQAGQLDALPTVAHALDQEQALFALLPDSQKKILQQSLLTNVRRNLSIVGAALKVSRLMNRAGIIPAWFKGTGGQLTGLYPGMGYRYQADIDLLVREEERDTANRVLLDAGYLYAVETTVDGERVLRGTADAAVREGLLARYRHHHHYPPMLRPGDGYSLELHRHPLDRHLQARLSLESVYSHLVRRERNGAVFLTPDPELGITLAILTRFVSDGLCAAFDFPLAQAGDCACQLARAEADNTSLDYDFIQQACGKYFPVFLGLMERLQGFESEALSGRAGDPTRFIRMMSLKASHPLAARAINTQGRLRHIARVLAHDPGRLSRRLGHR